MKNTRRQYGYGISGLMRDYLVLAGIEYKKAESLSIEFDKQIEKADWIHSYNGTTFTRSFDPCEVTVK